MKKLRKGDTIGLISPASFPKEKDIGKAIKKIEELGYKVKLGKNVGKKYFSMAGTDDERASDIMDMFLDKEIKAIISLRGGYGCIRLLEKLDYNIIKNNPKIFVGYSDLTALHMAFYTKSNLKSFHGPMGASNFAREIDDITIESFFNMVSQNIEDTYIGNSDVKFLSHGIAKGELVGGNLAVLTSLIGSEYDLDYKDKVLFLEDIGENTYKIDRMLWQLKNKGVFNEVSGIILGDFSYCEKSSDEDMNLEEVFKDHFENLYKPVVMNFKSGHCEPMITLPFGEKILIDSKKEFIKILK